jgi:hypothetical protein
MPLVSPANVAEPVSRCTISPPAGTVESLRLSFRMPIGATGLTLLEVLQPGRRRHINGSSQIKELRREPPVGPIVDLYEKVERF